MEKKIVLGMLLLVALNLAAVCYKMGELATSGDYPVMEINGDFAYVSDENYGLRVYDVTNPEQPQLHSSVSLCHIIHKILINGDLLILAHKDESFSIMDISDPGQPEIAGMYNTYFPCIGLAARSDYVYVLTSIETLTSTIQEIEVVDISDPTQPVNVTTFGLANFPTGCIITDTELYLGTYEGLFIYDISDITLLQEINWLNIGNVMCIELIDNMLFVDSSVGLRIIDVTDPTTGQMLSINQELDCYDFVVIDDMFYAAAGEKMVVGDISNLTSPSLLGIYYNEEYCANIAVKDSIVYANCYSEHFNLIDITNPQDEYIAGWQDVNAVKISKTPDNQIMMLNGFFYDGLQFYGMADPANPEFLYSHTNSNGTWGCKDFYVDDEICCSILGEIETQQFYLYDRNNLSSLNIIGETDLDFNGFDMIISGMGRKDDFVYMGCLVCGVVVVDISDPANPVQLLTHEEMCFVIDLTVDENYLYFVDIAGLHVMDITNLAPVEIDYWNSDSRAEAITINGDYLYLSNYCNIQVFDISDPYDLTLVNTIEIHPSSKLDREPIIEDGVMYITDRFWNQIYCFDLFDPANPQLQKTFAWNKYSNDIELFGDYLLCAHAGEPYEHLGITALELDAFATSTEDHEIVEKDRFFTMTNYPNPFNPSTKISYSLTQNLSFVDLSVYNIKGQKVKQLINEQLSAGQYSVNWYGKDDNGKSVTSGIYFYKMRAGGRYTNTRKMILLK